MSKPQVLSGLSDLVGRYDVILSDVWGVIHNGRESFPPATVNAVGSTTAL